jgi:Ca2+:H+ antiporter
MSLYNKILHPGQLFHQGQNQSAAGAQDIPSLHHRTSNAFLSGSLSRTDTPLPREREASGTSIQAPSSGPTGGKTQPSHSPSTQRRVSYAVAQPNFLPVMESVSHVVKNTDLSNMKLPEPMTTDDFTRAVAVATVSALRHQQAHGRPRADQDSASGHDAPSWSRLTSASVLLTCTFLYALIAGVSPH